MKDWLEILETCDLQNWKEALAAVMTYAKPEEFSSLCGESAVFSMCQKITLQLDIMIAGLIRSNII